MEFFKNLKFAWNYAKDQKKNLIWFIIVNILIIIISVVVPILSAKIIVYLTDNEFHQLLLIALIILLVEWFRNVCNYFKRHNSNILFRETYVNLQTSLGKEILKIENKSIDSTGSGLFIQRLTNDTSKLSDIFPMLIDFLTNIVTDIGIFVAIFIINKVVFIYMMIATIILYLIERKRVKLRNENDKKFRKMNEKVSSFVGEMVRGIRDIKMLNSEDSFINELHSKVIELNTERYRMNKVDRNYGLYSGTLLDLKDFLLIVLLIILIENKDITIASALIIHNYSSRVSNVIYWVGSLLERVKDFNLSVDRIKEIMNGDKFEKESFGNKHIDKVNGDFEFKDVTFAYDEKKILDKINFKVKANSTVAFVGKSGAGKTTIFNLLCKLYNIDSGEITIDGININDKCGSTHLEMLKEYVVKNKMSLGIAYDGDGDRCLAVDENGEELDGDKILAIIANYLKPQGKLAKDTIVATVMSNLGLNKYAESNKLNFVQTKVGDRYVLEEMLKNGYNLGGEQSGHVILLDYNPTGDGILTSLMLIQALLESGKKSSELGDLVQKYPQVLINAKVDSNKKYDYEKNSEIKSAIEKVEKEFSGNGRVLIRPSGTEPLVRVMIEGKDIKVIEQRAKEIADLIEEKCK